MAQFDRVQPWRTESEETVADCRVFRVRKQRMRQEGDAARSSVGDFFVIDNPDWVNVLALTPERDLVLVEQWRYGVNRATLEIPGGMVDGGEAPRDAAERELREETGYEAPTWYRLGTIEPNPAIQSNRCHTFLALDAVPRRAQSPDEHEAIVVTTKPRSTLDTLVAEGRITHSLVVVGFHYLRLWEEGLLPEGGAPFPA